MRCADTWPVSAARFIPPRAVENLAVLGEFDVALCDVTPRQLLHIAGDRLSPGYRRKLETLSLRPGRLQSRLRFVQPDSVEGRGLRAFGDGAHRRHAGRDSSSRKMRCGTAARPSGRLCCSRSRRCSIRRARPQGKHIAWAYCHVPTARRSTCCRGSRRRSSASRRAFATAFWSGECFLRRRWRRWMRTWSAATLAAGWLNLPQFLFRPTMRYYATSATRYLYLLVVHAAGRRGTRHVRLQCSQAGAETNVSDRARSRHRAAKLPWRCASPSVGGFVDAVGYIALFEVFTANMSGNSVHMGMYLGQRDWLKLLRPLCAIVSYVVGMLVDAHYVGDCRTQEGSAVSRRSPWRWRRFCCSFRARHAGDASRPDRRPAVARLLSRWWPCWPFAMGVQTATLTHIGALTVYTTFVTGTLTKLTESFTRVLFWATISCANGHIPHCQARVPGSATCGRPRCWPRPGLLMLSGRRWAL